MIFQKLILRLPLSMKNINITVYELCSVLVRTLFCLRYMHAFSLKFIVGIITMKYISINYFLKLQRIIYIYVYVFIQYFQQSDTE